MKSAWGKWKKIAKKATAIQANILFTILYILMIIPLCFLVKNNLSKSLQIKIDKKKKSYWIKKEKRVQDLNWAYKQ